MIRQLWKNVEPRRMKPDGTNYQVAAGTTNLTSDAIDTIGYSSLAIAVLFGAIVSGAATSVKLQHSSDDGSTDAYADIAGTSQTVADTDDNKMVLISVYRPTKRYVKVITSRATQNSTVDGVVAFLALPGNAPVSFGTTVQGTPEFFNSPAAGTA